MSEIKQLTPAQTKRLQMLVGEKLRTEIAFNDFLAYLREEHQASAGEGWTGIDIDAGQLLQGDFTPTDKNGLSLDK